MRARAAFSATRYPSGASCNIRSSVGYQYVIEWYEKMNVAIRIDE